MKITRCLLAAAALLSGCSKPAAPAPAVKIDPVRWEYQTFSFTGKKDLGSFYFVPYIRFYDVGSSPSNVVVETSFAVLNLAG